MSKNSGWTGPQINAESGRAAKILFKTGPGRTGLNTTGPSRQKTGPVAALTRRQPLDFIAESGNEK